MMCVYRLIEKPWIHMVAPDKCNKTTPEEEKHCNRFSCPAYWVEEKWSPVN